VPKIAHGLELPTSERATITRHSLIQRRTATTCLIFAALTFSEVHALAQTPDSLLNGTVIGAAVGAGVGVAFTHSVRDSDLTLGQYAYGALVFGAIGAGAGLGLDALLERRTPGRARPPQRLSIAPTIWRDVKGLSVMWKW
jgi:hypothetical protein